MPRRLARNLTAALISLGVSGTAYAGPITFTFDNAGSCTGLSAGAQATTAPSGPTIQNYMNCMLTGTGGTVAVSAGAVASKGAASGTGGNSVAAGYTGDGHAVGATGSNQSLTLGNTTNATFDGAPLVASGTPDAFIMNNALASSSYTSFAFQFSGLTIAAGSTIKFDYQIFPDGTCLALNTSNCGWNGTTWTNRPDFKFYIGTVGPANLVATMLGDTPSSALGGYTDSPATTGTAAELTPQELGTYSYLVVSDLVNPLLSFVDWPATIGIDNLQITTPNPPVPEPVTVVLVGLGMVGLRSYRRRVAA